MMVEKLHHVRHLSRKERHVLQLLRDAAGCAADPYMAKAFGRLVREAQHVDFGFGVSEAPYATPGELTLLGLLALHQRQAVFTGYRSAHFAMLLAALQICADLLRDQGCVLDYGSASRIAQPKPSEYDRSPREPTDIANRTLMVCMETLQDRVHRFVAEQGSVSTQDLRRFGVSRQMVHIMCRKGQLRRAVRGFYVASSRMERDSPSAHPASFSVSK